MKLNSALLKSTFVAALGGLLFGFDTAVIAGATQALKELYHLAPFWLGFTVASALVGTVIGSMLAGIPGDRLGRRASLRWMAVLYVVSALGCAFAWNWSALVFFRFIGGLGIGGSSVLGPMYIAEIAPAKWRGRLVGIFQFNVVFGILLAYFSNYAVGTMGFGDAEWRWKLGVSALPATLFLGMLLGIPESPRWLVKKHPKEKRGGQCGNAELPTPLRVAEAHGANCVIRKVCEQNSEDDVELKDADQTAAPLCRSNFRNVHRAENRRPANTKPADEAKENKGAPVPGKRTTQSRDDVQHRHPTQTSAPAKAVARNAREHRANHCTYQRAGHGKSEPERREVIELLESLRGSGDDRGVESEEESSQCGHERTLQKRGVQFHGTCL